MLRDGSRASTPRRRWSRRCANRAPRDCRRARPSPPRLTRSPTHWPARPPAAHLRARRDAGSAIASVARGVALMRVGEGEPCDLAVCRRGRRLDLSAALNLAPGGALLAVVPRPHPLWDCRRATAETGAPNWRPPASAIIGSAPVSDGPWPCEVIWARRRTSSVALDPHRPRRRSRLALDRGRRRGRLRRRARIRRAISIVTPEHSGRRDRLLGQGCRTILWRRRAGCCRVLPGSPRRRRARQVAAVAGDQRRAAARR